MKDVGMAMQRAEDKAKKMKAKFEVLKEMINCGVLTDHTSNKDKIEKELEKITVQNSVNEDLAKLKTEKDCKKKQQAE
jgi:phage shock protein A